MGRTLENVESVIHGQEQLQQLSTTTQEVDIIWGSRILCEQIWSPIREISISAVQFEHLIMGVKLDDFAGESINVAIALPGVRPSHTTGRRHVGKRVDPS